MKYFEKQAHICRPVECALLALHTACTFHPLHGPERHKQLHALTILQRAFFASSNSGAPKNIEQTAQSNKYFHPFPISDCFSTLPTANRIWGRQHIYQLASSRTSAVRLRTRTIRPKHHYRVLENTFTPLPYPKNRQSQKNNRPTKKRTHNIILSCVQGRQRYCCTVAILPSSDCTRFRGTARNVDMKKQHKNSTHASSTCAYLPLINVEAEASTRANAAFDDRDATPQCTLPCSTA